MRSDSTTKGLRDAGKEVELRTYEDGPAHRLSLLFS